MTWIDTAVIVAVVSVGMVILYRGLKEPLDLLFHGIAKLFGSIRDMLTGGAQEQMEVITYGR